MKKILTVIILLNTFILDCKAIFDELEEYSMSLVSFNAQQTGNEVRVFWKTFKEINLNYYTVERSSDAYTFVPIIKVDGVGNNDKPNYYEVIDLNPIIGINYYRLKQTDYNGNIRYSEPVSVYFNPEEGKTKIKVFPNPSLKSVNVKVELLDFEFKENITILVKNVHGYFSISDQVRVNSKGYLVWQLPDCIPSGTYLINVVSHNKVYYEKLIIN